MKDLQKYIVKRAFGTCKVGDIVQPTGMRRDELKMLGWIKPFHDATAPAPVVEPEPAPAPEPEPEPVVEAVAVVNEIETATRRRGRPRKGGY